MRLPQRLADFTLACALVLLLVATLLATGCASAGLAARPYGDAAGAPLVDAVVARGDSLHLEVALASPASVVLLHVVPGRGVTVLELAGGTTLAAGAHHLVARRPLRALDDRDVAGDVRARTTRRMSERSSVLAPTRIPLRERPAPRPPAYLLLVVTDRAVAAARVHDALQGTTVPLHADEALRAAGKRVRELAGAGRWAGVGVRLRD